VILYDMATIRESGSGCPMPRALLNCLAFAILDGDNPVLDWKNV
jgi:hypothetical protein